MGWIANTTRSGLAAPMNAERMRPPSGAFLYCPPAEAPTESGESRPDSVRPVTSGSQASPIAGSRLSHDDKAVIPRPALVLRRRAG